MEYWVPYVYLAIAIVLEVTANTFLQRSAGMTKLIPGMIGIVFIFASFTALSQSLKAMDMATAYAIWGGSGIILTALAGWAFFQQPLSRKSMAGLFMISAGLALLKLG